MWTQNPFKSHSVLSPTCLVAARDAAAARFGAAARRRPARTQRPCAVLHSPPQGLIGGPSKGVLIMRIIVYRVPLKGFGIDIFMGTIWLVLEIWGSFRWVLL